MREESKYSFEWRKKEYRVGMRRIYGARGKTGKKTERVLEFDFFNSGPMIQMWFQGAERPEMVRARIKKEGRWVSGLAHKGPELQGLTAEGAFVGVRIMLQTMPRATQSVDVFNPDYLASEILKGLGG